MIRCICLQRQELLQSSQSHMKKKNTVLIWLKLQFRIGWQFLISLLTIGVNSIVLHEGEACSEAEISEIVNVVDYSKVPEEKRSLLNPTAAFIYDIFCAGTAKTDSG